MSEREVSEELLKMIASASWRKTNYIAPHEYIVQKNEPALHAALSELIDNHGYPFMFLGKEYTCYDIGDYRYWHMEEIINRALKPKKDGVG